MGHDTASRNGSVYSRPRVDKRLLGSASRDGAQLGVRGPLVGQVLNGAGHRTGAASGQESGQRGVTEQEAPSRRRSPGASRGALR
jgi:hypothetical protein